MIKALKEHKLADEYYTPRYAVEPLLEYLPNNITIWECAGNDSNITLLLRGHGYNVIETHIDNGFDFLKDEPNFDFDMIITNPPFSLKNGFLERAYAYNKPFCFLLPLTALEGIKRGKLYSKYGVEVMVFNRRIQFANGGNVWFSSGWFCHNVLPDKLIFKELKNG